MFRLRPMIKSDLNFVLEWRNRPEIRKNMYTTNIISKKEHYAYFDKVWDNPTIDYLICETIDNIPVGVVNFVKIDIVNQNAFWAFYSGDLSRRGVGIWMEFLALNYAFESLGLIKLSCEVLDYNMSVVNFHRKFGFKIEGVFHKHHKVENAFSDVYRLTMFRDDWMEYQKTFFEKKLKGEIKNEQFKINSKFEESFVLTKNEIRKFAESLGDNNSVHNNDYYAEQPKLEEVLSHGMHAGAVFSRIIREKFPGNGSTHLKQTFEFYSSIYPDIDLKACLKILHKVGRFVILETLIKDFNNNVILKGEAEVLIPKIKI